MLCKNCGCSTALTLQPNGAQPHMTDVTDPAPDLGLISNDEPAAWTSADLADLARAVHALERTSFATCLNGMLGRQIGFAGELVPERIAKAANAAAARALRYAMKGVLKTLGQEHKPASPRLHLAAVAASGAVGGAFGLATLPLELPVSTALILRSVAAIARDEGEDLEQPEAGLACIEVFALGAGEETRSLGESSYFAARALLAKSVSEAARYAIQRGLVEESAPVLVRLFAQIASRFGLVVTQKLVAQTVPVLGAFTGAAINAAFLDHYQNMARGHFIVRRLERRYGMAAVRRRFDDMRGSRAGDPEVSADILVGHGSRQPVPALPSRTASGS